MQPAAMNKRPADPMDLGDIVTSAAILCVRQARFVLPMALVTVVATLISDIGLIPIAAAIPAPAGAQTPALPDIPLRFAPLLLVGIIILLFNQLAFMRFGIEVWCNGAGALTAAYSMALRRLVPGVAAAVITGTVFVLGMAIWIGIPFALYFFVCWFFAGQVCVAEGETNPLRALVRSRAIVRGNWWRTAGILAGVTLIGLLPSILVGWIRTPNITHALALSAIATGIAAPFVAVAQTLLYVDLRIRKHESIDLAASEPAEPV
jgi:hypothetical protein